MKIFKSFQLLWHWPASNAECTRQFQTTIRSEADKGYFFIICRDFLRSVKVIVFIIHPVFYMHLFVVVAVVKFPVLHPAFQLFPSCCFQYFSQCISKINNPYFLSLGCSNHIFMLRSVITDTAFYGQALFFKVDVLPCKTTGFPDTKSCIICDLNRQNCRWIFLFQILDKPLVILMWNRLCTFFYLIIRKEVNFLCLSFQLDILHWIETD